MLILKESVSMTLRAIDRTPDNLPSNYRRHGEAGVNCSIVNNLPIKTCHFAALTSHRKERLEFSQLTSGALTTELLIILAASAYETL